MSHAVLGPEASLLVGGHARHAEMSIRRYTHFDAFYHYYWVDAFYYCFGVDAFFLGGVPLIFNSITIVSHILNFPWRPSSYRLGAVFLIWIFEF